MKSQVSMLMLPIINTTLKNGSTGDSRSIMSQRILSTVNSRLSSREQHRSRAGHLARSAMMYSGHPGDSRSKVDIHIIWCSRKPHCKKRTQTNAMATKGSNMRARYHTVGRAMRISIGGMNKIMRCRAD